MSNKIPNIQYDNQMMLKLQRLSLIPKYLFITGSLGLALAVIIVFSQGGIEYELDMSTKATCIILALISFTIFGIALIVIKKAKKAKNELSGMYSRVLLEKIQVSQVLTIMVLRVIM